MTYVRPLTITYGIGLIGLGICGFIPAFLGPPMVGVNDRVIHIFDGTLFGWYPVNAVLSGLYLAIGVMGLLMTSRLTLAQRYAQIVTVLFAVLAVMGFFPVTNTLFGLAPLQRGDIALNTFLAVVALPFAFLMPTTIQETERGPWPPERGIPQN